MPSNLLSTNIRHPNTFSIRSGETQLVKEFKAINQSINKILTTSKGELFGDPEFGCNLQTLLFEFQGNDLNSLIKEEIVTALNQYEKRIFIQEKDIEITNNQLSIEILIKYSLRYTDLRSSYRYITAIIKEGMTNG